MIPKAITAPFRWWAKHPWMVFWGTILLYLVIVIALGALYRPSVFVLRTIGLLLAIVMILSFSQGVFVTWQRSKFQVAMIVIGLLVIFFIGTCTYRDEKWGREVVTRFDPVITVLDKYRNDTGEYPDSLDKLAPTYLAEIPICPFYHEQATTVITSQYPTKEWHQLIGKPTIADAICDRLLHHSYKIELKGESIRKSKK